MIKKLIVLLAFGVFFASASPAQAAAGFSDVPANIWYEDALKDLVDRGVVGGYDDGTFRPDKKMVRQELASMLIRALEFDENEDWSDPEFTDVRQGDWFYKPVAAAKELGILNGTSETTFGTGQSLTREMMAGALVKAYSLKGIINTNQITLPYKDTAGNYYEQDLKILYALGIIAPGEKYNPKEVVDRKMFVSFLYKTINATEGLFSNIQAIDNGNGTVTVSGKINAKGSKPIIIDLYDYYDYEINYSYTASVDANGNFTVTTEKLDSGMYDVYVATHEYWYSDYTEVEVQ